MPESIGAPVEFDKPLMVAALIPALATLEFVVHEEQRHLPSGLQTSTAGTTEEILGEITADAIGTPIMPDLAVVLRQQPANTKLYLTRHILHSSDVQLNDGYSWLGYESLPSQLINPFISRLQQRRKRLVRPGQY